MPLGFKLLTEKEGRKVFNQSPVSGRFINSLKFFDFICAVYTARLQFVLFTDEKNQPEALLPLFIYQLQGRETVASIPKPYGTLIFFGKQPFDYSRIVPAVRSLFSKIALHLTLISVRSNDKNLSCFGKDIIKTFLLPISSKIDLPLIPKKRRNLVKKALKNKLTLRNIDLRNFYHLYTKTARRLGSHPKKAAYFRQISEVFGADAVIMGCFRGKILIGANLYICNDKYWLLMHNVSLKKYWELGANDLLYYSFIKDAANAGASWVDFGPSVLTDVSHIHFKTSFGAAEYPVYRYLYAPNIFGKLKIRVTLLKDKAMEIKHKYATFLHH